MKEAKVSKEQQVKSTDINSPGGKTHDPVEARNNKASSVNYVLIRASSRDKALQAISMLRTRFSLKLLDRPKVMLPAVADSLTEEVMQSPIKNRSKVAVVLKVQHSDVKRFIKALRHSKVPAHVVIITTKYRKVFKKIDVVYKDLDDL